MAIQVPHHRVAEAVGEHGHAAGTLFIAPEGDMLFLLRSPAEENFGGHHALPGGGAEDGESPRETALREAAEEIGEVPRSGPMKLLDRTETPRGLAFHTFAQPVSHRFVPRLNGEHTSHVWRQPHDLPEPIHPAVAATIKNQLRGGKDAAEMSPEEWQEANANLLAWLNEKPEAGQAQDIALALDEASVRSYDKDGRLHVAATPISKANVCEYLGREIPDAERLGLDLNRKYKLLRHPDELKKAVDTFNNLPLLREHVPVSAMDYKPELVIGSTGTNAAFDGGYLNNSLVIWSQDDINDVETNRRKELSSAYRYRADMTPGSYEGEPYDGVMRDIVGNHVALVSEGRCGPDVVVGDSKENVNMTKPALTRKAALVQGALDKFIKPRLAADAKLDATHLFVGVTNANYAAKRPAIAEGVSKLAAGKLAQDAKLDDLSTFLMAFDAVEVEEKKAEDGDLPENELENPRDIAQDDPFAQVEQFLKGRLSDEDMMALGELLASIGAATQQHEGAEIEAARDEEPEEKKDMVTKSEMKQAMDSALKAHGERIRENERGIRIALQEVRPWVGELSPSLAMDSKADVYRHALVALGVSDAKKLHPDALLPVLQAQPKPNERRSFVPQTVSLGMDEASIDEATKIAPGLARIKAA